MVILIILLIAIICVVYKYRTIIFGVLLYFYYSITDKPEEESSKSEGNNNLYGARDYEFTQTYIKRISKNFCEVTKRAYAISEKPVTSEELFIMLANTNRLKLHGMTNKVIVIEDVVASVGVIDGYPCIDFGELGYSIYQSMTTGNEYYKHICCYIEDFHSNTFKVAENIKRGDKITIMGIFCIKDRMEMEISIRDAQLLVLNGEKFDLGVVTYHMFDK